MTRETVPVRFKSESAAGHGPTVLEIGGHDFASHARGVVMRAEVGSIATVEVEAYAMNGMEFELPAAVTVNIQPLQEGEMDVTTLADGTVRYRFVRKQAVDA